MRSRHANGRAPDRLAPPLPPRPRRGRALPWSSNICTKCALSLSAASASKKASKMPARLSRQKRFQIEFQWPNSAERARQVMLWTVK